MDRRASSAVAARAHFITTKWNVSIEDRHSSRSRRTRISCDTNENFIALNASPVWVATSRSGAARICCTCLEEAPNLLKTNDDETAVYFVKQPEGDAETAAAQRSMEVCPTLAIGNDG